MSTGADNRLILEGVGPLDTVYLRAGYQYSDYEAFNIDEQECCQALMATRVFIEQHRVAVNATVGQQLATSKRVQMLLSQLGYDEFVAFGLTLQEAKIAKTILGEMLPISPDSINLAKESPSETGFSKIRVKAGALSVWCGYPDKTDGTHSTTISVPVADAPFTPSAPSYAHLDCA